MHVVSILVLLACLRLITAYYFGGPCECNISTNQSSATYPAGSSQTVGTSSLIYTSSTDDPLGPWYNESVLFYSATSIGDTIVFDYLITCIYSCSVTAITMEGAGFADDDFLTLYGGDENETMQLASMQIPQRTRLQSITLSNPIAYSSTRFHLIETNSRFWRYRSYLTMTTSLTRPPTSSPTAPTTAAPTSSPSQPTAAPTGPPTISSISLNDACGCTVQVNFTSPTYHGGEYQSTSTQPLGAWWGESVSFYGTNRGDAIIYDFYISCSELCWITKITVEGKGWFVPDNLTLYNGDKSVQFGSMSLTADDNSFQSYALDLSSNPEYATSFRLIEVNESPFARVRSLLNLTTVAVISADPSRSPTSEPTHESVGDLLTTTRRLQDDDDDQGEDALQSSNDHLFSFAGGIATGIAVLGCCLLSIFCVVKRIRDRANSKQNLQEMDHSVQVETPKTEPGGVESPGQVHRMITPSSAFAESPGADGPAFSTPTNHDLEGMQHEGTNGEYGGTLALQMQHNDGIEMVDVAVGGIGANEKEMSLADGEFVVGDEESMVED